MEIRDALQCHEKASALRPHIVITPGLDEKDRSALLQYVREKGYDHIELGFNDRGTWRSLKADIIIYQKPYAYFVDAAASPIGATMSVAMLRSIRVQHSLSRLEA